MRSTLKLGLVVFLVVVACNGATDEPTTTSSTTTTASPEATEMFGKVASIADDDETLVIELAEWLTGEEARQAAVEAGVIEEGEDLPNDIFIRSLERTEEMILSDGAEILLLGFNAGVPAPVPVDRQEFVEAFRSRFESPEWYGGDYYEMTVEGDSILRLQQFYLP